MRSKDPNQPNLGSFMARTVGEPVTTGWLEDDPVKDIREYALNKWLQNLCAVRTQCFRCRKDSDAVYVPFGKFAFGNPRNLRRGDVDITEDAILAFGKIGWKFQKHKSYCPDCKGLGSI